MAANQREILLSDVENAIASLSCKIYNYSKIGKPTVDFSQRVTALLNYQWLLCNYEVESCDIDCIRCAYDRLK